VKAAVKLTPVDVSKVPVSDFMHRNTAP